MRPLINHVRRHAVGYVALFVALGGTGYAAMSLPRGSVGAPQIQNHSITALKFNQRSIGGNVRAWAVVNSDGKVLAGGGKPHGNETVLPGVYYISWGVNLRRGCATVASIDFAHSPITETIPVLGSQTPMTAGYATVATNGGSSRKNNVTVVHTFNQSGQLTPLGTDVTVAC